MCINNQKINHVNKHKNLRGLTDYKVAKRKQLFAKCVQCFFFFLIH